MGLFLPRMTALPPSPPFRSPWSWLPPLIICLVLAAAYANSFRVPFIFDDASSILENPTLHDWRTALFPPRDSGLTVSGRPLLNLSFAIDRALYGEHVAGYHATNLLIHALAGIALFGLVRRTLRLCTASSSTHNDDLFAALVSIIWVLHPLQTESVTYIVQRAESLVGLCYLFTFYAFARAIQSATHTRLWLTFSVVVCFAGMAAKEVMVSAPLLVHLYDRTFAAGSFRNAWRARRAFYLTLASSWLILTTCIVASGGRGGTVGTFDDITVVSYFLTQCQAIVHYLRLGLWPDPLVLDYGTRVVSGFGEVAGQFSLLTILAALTAYAVWKHPRIGFLGTTFFALLAPTSSFVPVNTQTMAEHRMYLPLAPVLILVSSLIWRMNVRVFMAVGVSVSFFFGILTHRRNHDYRSATSIWEDTIAKAPNNARAYTSLGTLLAKAGDFVAAEPLLERALALAPQDPSAHLAYGNALIVLGRRDEGYGYYERALALKPDYHDALYNYGKNLLDEGRVADAITRLEQAVASKPAAVNAHYNLGNAYLAAGRYAYSVKEYSFVIENDPAAIDALNNRGIARAALGDTEAAIRDYQQALEHAPGEARTLINLGRTFAQAGRHAEAIEYFTQAVQNDPTLPQAHANLGLALSASGRATEAIAPWRKALQLGLDDPALHTRLAQTLLELGRADEAIRELASLVARHPDFVDARYVHANLLLQSGRAGEALEHYLVLRRLAPQSAEIANNLGIAFAQLGRLDDARAAFTDALALDPAFSEARENLQRARE